jgi:hypothetical protein
MPTLGPSGPVGRRAESALWPVHHGRTMGNRRYLQAKRPEIASGSVYCVPRCLAQYQPVSPVGPWPAAPTLALVTWPVTQKALSYWERAPELRKLVAGEGFEPSTSGL